MAQPGSNEVVLTTDGLAAETANKPDASNAPDLAGFKSVEELTAAYKATQKPADEVKPPVDTKPDDKSGIETIADDAEVKDALAKSGLNSEEFSTEYARDGKLSDDSYKKLADAGYPKEMVDIYVEGLNARSQAYSASVYGPAGGEKGYTDLVKWAATNASKEQKTAFNEAVTSGDSARAALAVQAMVAQKNGGKLFNGKPGGDTGPQPFRSNAEMVEAMRNPKYHRDPAYNAEVAARLRVSPNF